MKFFLNGVMIVVLVVIMPTLGLGQTVLLEDIKAERHYLCISAEKIESVFKSSTIEWSKTVKDNEKNIYQKMCILTIEGNYFSKILLISEDIENPIMQAKCIYMEFSYDNKTLYLKEAPEKIWWQGSNLLNNTNVISPE